MFYRKNAKDQGNKRLFLAFVPPMQRRRKRLERFQQGDPNEFNRVYKKFRRPLLNYVSQRVKNENVAEELTQEIFLKAFRFRESYQPDFQLSTWLWTIARNTVSDWQRKRGNASGIEEVGTEAPLDVDQIPAAQATIEHEMSEKSDHETVAQIMSSLTELQREAFFMRVIHQLSYQEISKRLKISLSAAKCLVHRAKGSLAKRLHRDPKHWDIAMKESG